MTAENNQELPQNENQVEFSEKISARDPRTGEIKTFNSTEDMMAWKEEQNSRDNR